MQIISAIRFPLLYVSGEKSVSMANHINHRNLKLINLIVKYSRSSLKEHSRKRTTLLTDGLTKPRCNSHTNSVFSHSRKFRKTRRRFSFVFKLL